jgi:hypothetical protein
VSVVQTVLAFVLPPVVIYAVVALLTIAPRTARRPRYRTGEKWDYEPVLWTANPEGAHLPAHTEHIEPQGAATTGGARGHW